MSTKYFKIQSSQTDKTYKGNEQSFREDHNIEGDGSEEAIFLTILQQMITDKKVTVKQYFKTNATYHKMEFLSDSDDTQIQTLFDSISSFDKLQVSVIDADIYATNKTDSELSESFRQYEQLTIDFRKFDVDN